jgi:hypothetical protein
VTREDNICLMCNEQNCDIGHSLLEHVQKWKVKIVNCEKNYKLHTFIFFYTYIDFRNIDGEIEMNYT